MAYLQPGNSSKIVFTTSTDWNPIWWTVFHMIFKRKTHFIVKNLESPLRKFNRLAFASQDHCSFGHRQGENKRKYTGHCHAAINWWSEDLTNSLIQEKEWLWDGYIFLWHGSYRERVSYLQVKSPPARLLPLSLCVMNFKRFGFHLGKGWECVSKCQKSSHYRNIIYLSSVLKS